MKHIDNYSVNEIKACFALAELKISNKESKDANALRAALSDCIQNGDAPTIEEVIEETHQYLKNWYRDDRTTDFEIAYDTGFDEICRYLMLGTGVINEGNNKYENAICLLPVSYERFEELCTECFKGCTVLENPDTNETYWIPSLEHQSVFYFIEEKDLIPDGYTKKHIFGSSKTTNLAFDVHYRCYKCQHEWSEEYSTACDSECPECDAKNVTALNWEVVEKATV